MRTRQGSFHPIVISTMVLLVLAVTASFAIPAYLRKVREGSERSPTQALRAIVEAQAAHKEREGAYWAGDLSGLPGLDPRFAKEYAGHIVQRVPRNGFSYCAYPVRYGSSGKRTFLVSEEGILWWKDNGGVPADVFPSDPAKAGWTKLD